MRGPTTAGRKRVYVYGKTRREAREKLAALQGELDRGVRVSEENWTIEGYLAHWLETVVRPNRAPKTHQGYELVVRRHIVPVLGRKRLRSLSVLDVRELVGVLEEQGMGVRGIQQTHAVLRNALQSAMRDELVVRNVAKLVQVKTPRYEVGRGLSVDQARTLLRRSQSDRLHALYVLAVYLGLRRGSCSGCAGRAWTSTGVPPGHPHPATRRRGAAVPAPQDTALSPDNPAAASVRRGVACTPGRAGQGAVGRGDGLGGCGHGVRYDAGDADRAGQPPPQLVRRPGGLGEPLHGSTTCATPA